MAALPDGYVDTGRTTGVSHGGSVQLTKINSDPGAGIEGVISGWELYWEAEEFNNGPDPDPNLTRRIYRIYIQPPDGSAPVLVETIIITEGEYASGGGERESQAYALADTRGPFRLGMRLELIGASAQPQFAKDYALRFNWFGDRTTTQTLTFGPESRNYYLQSDGTWGSTQDPSDFTPVSMDLGGVSITGVVSLTGTDPGVQFRGLTVAGVLVDTGDLNVGVLHGLGGGDVDAYGNGTDAASATPPYVLTYDVAVNRFGPASGSPSVTIDTAHQTAQAIPYSGTTTFRQVSWAASTFAGYEEASLNAASAAAQTPAAFLANDLHLLLDLGILTDDRANLTHYTPGNPITFASSLNVHRPDGNTPSSFVTSDGAKLTVTEGGSTSTFDVSATGAHVTRTLVEDWRGGTDYYRTKHAAGDDIWGWEWYRFLRLGINAPTADDLTLTVTGVLLEVSDDHGTSGDPPTYTEHAFTRVYPVPLASGANTVDIDLMFPNAGGPVNYGRVDSIKLEGFGVGTYTLSEISLVSKETYAGSTLGGTVNLKSAFGEPVSRGGNYDFWHATQNGANGTLELPDQSQKSERGEYGGAVVYINEVTGTGSGLTLDTQFSVQDVLNRISVLEGWTATYASAAATDALEDEFGSRISPEIAEFLDELYGHAEVAGQAFQWDAQIRARRLIPVPGIEFLVRSERSKGHGALEMLAAADDGTAAGSGETFDILRDDTDAVLETVTTDQWSMAFSGPLPANNSFAVQVGEYTLALRPRDRNRVPAIVPADEFHLDLLQRTDVPFWYRAYRLGTAATVGRSIDAGASWPATWTVGTGLMTEVHPSIPTLASSRWGDVLALWHDNTGDIAIHRYDPNTDSWPLHSANVTNRRYPRMVAQLHRQVMAYHDGTDLKFVSDQDWFTSTETAIAGLTISAVPVQLCVLREDRRGWLHVVYVDGSGNLLHRYSEDGLTWSATQTLDTGVTGFVGYAQTLSAALLTYWKTTTLHVLRLEEDYRTVDGAVTAPTGSWVRGTMPVYGSLAEDVFLVGKIGSDLETRYSTDLGASFAEPS